MPEATRSAKDELTAEAWMSGPVPPSGRVPPSRPVRLRGCARTHSPASAYEFACVVPRITLVRETRPRRRPGADTGAPHFSTAKRRSGGPAGVMRGGLLGRSLGHDSPRPPAVQGPRFLTSSPAPTYETPEASLEISRELGPRDPADHHWHQAPTATNPGPLTGLRVAPRSLPWLTRCSPARTQMDGDRPMRTADASSPRTTGSQPAAGGGSSASMAGCKEVTSASSVAFSTSPSWALSRSSSPLGRRPGRRLIVCISPRAGTTDGGRSSCGIPTERAPRAWWARRDDRR
ncbi:hypothetical protein M2271_007471 [Streptomyces sp. LBL]|nr:hypothetical protein [Streptomyces sp. LBL]